MCVDIGCLNFIFPTSVAEEDTSTFHPPKLDCRDAKRIGPVFNRGAYEAVGEKRHKILDNAEILLPTLDFTDPVNFACAECLEASLLTGKLSTRHPSSVKTIRKDFASGNLVAFPKSIGKKALGERRSLELEVHLYKSI